MGKFVSRPVLTIQSCVPPLHSLFTEEGFASKWLRAGLKTASNVLPELVFIAQEEYMFKQISANAIRR